MADLEDWTSEEEKKNDKPCVDCGNTEETHLCTGPALLPVGEMGYLCPVCHEQRAHWHRQHGEAKPLPHNRRCC
ncbi:MAG: hypothetical protein G01um101419_818 [Parcubacteria group bacterium Gr01-1014_19]|nr:MAG: hypothetical protein G01um101419_818 [Parcubacteria group bacterium Gr01-1014_19]